MRDSFTCKTIIQFEFHAYVSALNNKCRLHLLFKADGLPAYHSSCVARLPYRNGHQFPADVFPQATALELFNGNNMLGFLVPTLPHFPKCTFANAV